MNEQQEPGGPTPFVVLAITTAYEQGVGKGRDAVKRGTTINNPYSEGLGCRLAWDYGYEEGREQAQRMGEVPA